jgi:DNA-binding response OmpR family regulator
MSGNRFTSQGNRFEGQEGKGRALLVNGEEREQWVCREALQEAGFEVITCDSFEVAARYLESEHFDCVVMDQGSRNFEGRVVLERAVRQDRYRPVLVLTRCLDMNCYLEAMYMGAADYLEKPVTPAEMTRFVQTYVRSERAMERANAA